MKRTNKQIRKLNLYSNLVLRAHFKTPSGEDNVITKVGSWDKLKDMVRDIYMDNKWGMGDPDYSSSTLLKNRYGRFLTMLEFRESATDNDDLDSIMITNHLATVILTPSEAVELFYGSTTNNITGKANFQLLEAYLQKEGVYINPCDALSLKILTRTHHSGFADKKEDAPLNYYIGKFNSSFSTLKFTYDGLNFKSNILKDMSYYLSQVMVNENLIDTVPDVNLDNIYVALIVSRKRFYTKYEKMNTMYVPFKDFLKEIKKRIK